MANLFNPGDVVVLKSGGVPMTVDLVPGHRVTATATPLTVYRLVWQKGASPMQGVYAEHLIEKFVPPAK